MSLVEGVGDEVIEFLIGILFVSIGVIAWWSTRTVDRPIIRTVVVFERRAQNQSTEEHIRTEANNQRDYVEELTPTPPPSPATRASSPESRNKPPAASTSVSEDGAQVSNAASRRVADEQNAIVEAMDSEATVLRRRRLDFFENRQEQTTENQDTTETDINVGSINEQQPERKEEAQRYHDTEPEINTTAETVPERTQEVQHEDDITIKLKYINDDLRLVNGRLQEQLGNFKRRHFQCELSSDKLVRLIFNGQVLQRDDLTLAGCGLFDNCVVHCLVHQKRTAASAAAGGGTAHTVPNMASEGGGAAGIGGTRGGTRRTRSTTTNHTGNRDWDLGNLFFAIVSFMLGAAWYFRYEYAQLYTVTATVALVGLTGIFTVLLVGMYFPDPEPPTTPPPTGVRT